MSSYIFLVRFSITCILFYSCGKKNCTPNISGEVNQVLYDFVIDKRDYCRFSRIYFKTSIKNETSKEIDLNYLLNEINFCNIESTASSGTISITNSTNSKNRVEETCYVSFINADNIETILKPNNSIELTIVLLKEIKSLSLKEMSNDFIWLTNDFKIKIKNERDCKLSFTVNKNAKCNYRYYLDDKEINLSDSLSEFKRRPVIPTLSNE